MLFTIGLLAKLNHSLSTIYYKTLEYDLNNPLKVGTNTMSKIQLKQHVATVRS